MCNHKILRESYYSITQRFETFPHWKCPLNMSLGELQAFTHQSQRQTTNPWNVSQQHSNMRFYKIMISNGLVFGISAFIFGEFRSERQIFNVLITFKTNSQTLKFRNWSGGRSCALRVLLLASHFSVETGSMNQINLTSQTFSISTCQPQN